MEDRVKEICECCICTDLFTDPRMLPCIHTFCLSCLMEIAENSHLKPGDSMLCPLCRKPFTIPMEGMASLQKNFIIEQLLESPPSSSRPPDEPVSAECCEICKKKKKKDGTTQSSVVTHFCVQCCTNICSSCSEDHKKSGVFKGHELIQLESQMDQDTKRGSDTQPQHCDQHRGEQLSQYCLSCEQLICRKCCCEAHKGHNQADIEQSVKSQATTEAKPKKKPEAKPVATREARYGQKEKKAKPTATPEAKFGQKEKKGSVRFVTHLDLGEFSTSKVRGVTKVKNKIFVLLSEPNFVLVFNDSNTFSIQKTVSIREIGMPADIVSSKRSQCLYISDQSSQTRFIRLSVWKMTPDDFRLDKFLSLDSSLVSPSVISVSPNDNLLICRRATHFTQVESYGSDGKLIRRLPLPSDIQKPLCCVQKRNEDFIISHGVGSTSRWRICLVSSDGSNVLAHHDPGDIHSSLGVSMSLTFDWVDDLLFVTDTQRHRVSAFDSNSLQVKQILLTENDGEISFPFKIFFDSKKRQLLVTFRNAEQELNVYEVA